MRYTLIGSKENHFKSLMNPQAILHKAICIARPRKGILKISVY